MAPHEKGRRKKGRDNVEGLISLRWDEKGGGRQDRLGGSGVTTKEKKVSSPCLKLSLRGRNGLGVTGWRGDGDPSQSRGVLVLKGGELYPCFWGGGEKKGSAEKRGGDYSAP